MGILVLQAGEVDLDIENSFPFASKESAMLRYVGTELRAGTKAILCQVFRFCNFPSQNQSYLSLLFNIMFKLCFIFLYVFNISEYYRDLYATIKRNGAPLNSLTDLMGNQIT